MIFSVFQKNWVFGYSWSTLLWYRCYHPHRSRDALSPVCGIFKVYFKHFADLEEAEEEGVNRHGVDTKEGTEKGTVEDYVINNDVLEPPCYEVAADGNEEDWGVDVVEAEDVALLAECSSSTNFTIHA